MSWKISTRGIPQSITGVAPTLDYRFAIDRNEIDAISLTDKLTYTGGNGTFTGSDGFIQRATTNVPRFDHDPLSRQSLGLLSEGSKENLLLQSNGFNTTWTASNSSITAASGTAPDGTNAAWQFRDTVDVSNVTHALSQAISATSGVSYTLSVWGKAGTLTRLSLLFPAQIVTNQTQCIYDVSSGLVTFTGTEATASITTFPGGWFRCSMTMTATASASGSFAFRLFPLAGNVSYQGDGTGTILIWGAQLEAASSASTYIPTTSAAVTRTADSAIIDGTGVITGTYTMVEKPAGCAVVSGSNIELQPGFRAERIAVFPAALTNDQITAVRAAM
jgi:hypothetical protein